ncbi:MAG TPA: hypothetical protein VMX94_03190 [Armatimonadota bacterium]|nr:hypothetical protein [Armatimonadota bacterium]
MQKKSRLLILVMVVVIAAGGLTAAMSSARADLGDILKGAGIVLLVDRFSDELNKFINELTLNKGVGVADRTKVVPIISIGQGGYVGAAQVSGPAHLVEKVKAVAQLEARMSGKTFRIKALVPVESREITKDIKRVGGVGVSAIIDVKL